VGTQTIGQVPTLKISTRSPERVRTHSVEGVGHRYVFPVDVHERGDPYAASRERRRSCPIFENGRLTRRAGRLGRSHTVDRHKAFIPDDGWYRCSPTRYNATPIASNSIRVRSRPRCDVGRSTNGRQVTGKALVTRRRTKQHTMTNETNYRTKANAVFFAAIMVVSMVAVGFAAAPGCGR